MASRLKRHQLREGRKQIFISLVLLVGLVVLIFTFGARVIEFIGNAAFLIRGEEETSGPNRVSIIQPPILDRLPDATSEENITVAGSVVQDGGTVLLYVNGEQLDTERMSDELEFSFDVELEEGENVIRARYELDDERSDFSESQRIVFSREPPKLEDVSPSDGQEFKRGDQRIEVSGKTDPEARITVNGSQAFVSQGGEFSYTLQLSEGENKITVIARNSAGLEEKKEFTVRYSP